MSDNLKNFARKLVELSLDAEGQPSAERVAAVLETLRDEQPAARQRQLLRQYAHYMDAAVRRSEARIEYAGPEPKDVAAQIAAELGKQYGRKLTPRFVNNEALLGGLRVTVGDDVYDASVATRLQNLRTASAV